MVKKNEIVEKVPKEEINVNEIKVELLEYVKREVDLEVEKSIKKTTEKYIKEKKRKIWALRFIILILLFGYIITGIFLIKDHYFDKYLVKIEEKLVDPKEEPKKEKEETKEEKDPIEEKNNEEEAKKKLIDKYSGIFDKYIISEGNMYLEEFYDSKYTNKFLLSLTMEYIDQNSIEESDDIYILNEEIVKETSSKYLNKKVENETFDYNGITFKYVKSLKSYILNKKFEKNTTIIKREIVDVKESNIISIETREYIIIDNKVIDPLSRSVIGSSNDLEKIKDNCRNKTYLFSMKDGEYILEF